MHGLYDGGGGAGLEDYWAATRASPVGAGGFLWAFVDEGVLRADEAGRIDVKGNAAPDGVVGPYRQKEGSFFTIRQLWSPVQIAMKQLPAGFTGTLMVGNDYDHTNLDTVSFKAQLARFDPADTDGRAHRRWRVGDRAPARSRPRGPGALELSLPGVLEANRARDPLSATDATGAEIGRWSWMASPLLRRRAPPPCPPRAPPPRSRSMPRTRIAVSAAGIRYTFNKASGQLSEIDRERRGGSVAQARRCRSERRV